MSILLADIVLLSCCLYLTVITNRMEQVQPTLLLWIGLTIIGYLINLNIVKQTTHVGRIAIWNVCWMIVTAAVAALTFDCQPASIPLKIFVCGVLMVIQGHGIAQAILPHRAESHLTFLDIQVVVFAIFLAGCHMKDLTGVMGLQILGFLSVGYTLAALIFLRTSEEQVTVVKGDSVVGRARVFGLLGAIVAASVVLCAVLSIMAQHATRSLLDVFLLMLQGLKNGLARIGDVFKKLFSMLPGQEVAGELPTGSTSDPVAEETGLEAIMRLPDWVLPLVGIIIVAVIVFIVIRLIRRLRKEKISLNKKTYRRVEITSSSLQREKVSLFQRLLEKLKLRIKMYRERKTPQGLAVTIRKVGKSIGVEMLPDDSWHGYVLRLAPYGDTEKMMPLADYMKQYFYSGQMLELTREQYQTFAGALKTLKKPEKDSKKSD